MIRLICFLLCLSTQAAAEDSRLQVLDTGGALQSWLAVGRLDVRDRGFCTATMLDESHVLTAAHCVVQDGQVIDPVRMQFRAALRNGRFLAERRVRRVIVAQSFLEANSAQVHPEDIALLELERAVRLPNLRFFDVTAVPRGGQDVAVVSYGKDRDAAPSLQQHCTTLGQSGGITVLSCDVEFGSSGSPVFGQGARPVIVGMVAAMAELDGKRVALAVGLPQIVARLRSRLDAGDGLIRSDRSFKTVRPPKG